MDGPAPSASNSLIPAPVKSNPALTRPLRILLVNRALPAHGPGGLERHVEDLALGLRAAGCQVHLLSAPLLPAERPRLERAGVQLHAIPSANPAHYTVRYLLTVGRSIQQVLKRHPCDLIHAQEFALGFWIPPPSAPPLVLTVHGTITSETPLHPDVYEKLDRAGRLSAWLHYGRRFLYQPPWRRALRQAGRILVDSAFTHDELIRLEPECLDKIQRVPLGVREPGREPPSFEQARQRLGWEGIQLLTTGRLEWQKGHEIALRALAALPELNWHYTIVGTGSYASTLRRTIGRLGLQDRVTLAGWVPQEKKLLMTAASDLFLWPERTHPAFGLAGLESLLASTPVLAIRRGAIPEILEEGGGWLVEGTDESSFAAELGSLLAQPGLLRSAREGLRASALKRFSFDAMIQAVLAQYRLLLDG